MRKIFISIEVQDTDYSESKFLEWCDSTFGSVYTYEWTQKDTDELYKTDTTFRKLVKKAKVARKEKEDYIHKHN